jgi:hypothetical protein
MSEHTDPALIALLGATDALLAPCRALPRATVAGVLERRVEFHNRGLPMSGGGSGADRVAAHRACNNWERQGVVKFSRRRGIRTLWRLSDMEDWRLRFWSMLPGESEMVCVLSAMLEHIAAGHTYRESTRLVPETALSPKPLCKAAICGLEDILAPAFVRGFATSCSDADQLAWWYELTAAGEQFVCGWKAPSFVPPTKPDRQLLNSTADAYTEALHSGLQDRRAWRGEPTHTPVPLSIGFFPRNPPGCKPVVDSRGALARGSRR